MLSFPCFIYMLLYNISIAIISVYIITIFFNMQYFSCPVYRKISKIFEKLCFNISYCFYSFFVKKYFNYSFKEMLIDYAPSFLLSGFMAICVFFMGRIQINIWIKLIIQIIAGVTIYLGLAVLFRFDVMNILIKKLSRRNEK